ncbi:hypothetical protein MMC06_003945 [Schaereria dolodes]|nr:hypothetical protein [Schaereria dolodes]
MAAEKAVYQPKDAVTAAIRSTAITGLAGTLLSAVQNTLTKQNVTAWGIFTRTGGTIGVFAAMGGTYEFATLASANLREKDDSWNPSIGGFLAGSIMGLRFRTLPAVLGYGAGFAILLGAFDYTGGVLTGYDKDPNVDEYERKEALRKNRRRPIQETLEQLGEGRGIYGPGYDARRRERIKQNYGIDVPADPSLKMTTMVAKSRTETDPVQRFHNYYQHELTALREQIRRLEDTGLIGGERNDAVEHCLAGISRFSNEVRDASSYVPAYDQRIYGNGVKALVEELEKTRAGFATKPKFTFKTTKKNDSAISLSDAAEIASAQRRHIPGYRSNPPSSTESSMATTPAYLASPPNESSNITSETQVNNLDTIPESPTSARPPATEGDSLLNPHTAAIRKPSYTTPTVKSITSHNAAHIIYPSLASDATSSASITNVKNSVVDTSVPTTSGQPLAGLTIKNVRKSLLVCGSVNGAAHVTGVESSVIVVTTRQFRMHECWNCIVYLHCSSRPIIEDCHGIEFASLPEVYQTLPSLKSTPNQYSQVDDFKWIKAEHSPNWGILPPERIVPEEVWRHIVPGGPGWSLDDILKVTGVVML